MRGSVPFSELRQYRLSRYGLVFPFGIIYPSLGLSQAWRIQPLFLMKNAMLFGAVLVALVLPAVSQINSGSNGSDGAFSPTQNVEIDMADHPDGIYHYTSVNIPSGVTVTFKPNAANTPVVWLVQGDCVIGGTVSVNGISDFALVGSSGGPGGYRGGSAKLGPESPASAGHGPGGGNPEVDYPAGDPEAGHADDGGNASYGSVGARKTFAITGGWRGQAAPGEVYGNNFIVPLLGGSGGGGGQGGGGGGGGAILIAADNSVAVAGAVRADGANGTVRDGQGFPGGGGGGSGGSIRIVSKTISGAGQLSASGGTGLGGYSGGWYLNTAGGGRIRLDSLTNSYNGQTNGVVTRGYQPVILPPTSQAVALAIESVGGVAVTSIPSGQQSSPDVIVPAAQQNPVSIVVACTNIPLGSEIIVDVKPANGPAIRAVGLNNNGTQASSTATVQVEMPRGGGTIQAKAVSGIQLAANDYPNAERLSLAQTGWTADGERFKEVEVTGGLGVSSQLAYITESGKRYTLGSR